MILREIGREELRALRKAYVEDEGCVLSDAVVAEEASKILKALKAQKWVRAHPGEGSRISFSYSICAGKSIVADKSAEGLALARLVAGVASAKFRELVEAVSGVGGALAVNARVSRYSAGDFISPHYDAGEDNEERRMAYVFDFSTDIEEGAGGVLTFPREGNDKLYEPRFNSLILFAVPQYHYLSRIHQDSVGTRFTVTGWFSERKST
jgi:Rps23 Pro-64 3,4-dihydroxylase Tpa1-like proline 4-hydroxylase